MAKEQFQPIEMAAIMGIYHGQISYTDLQQNLSHYLDQIVTGGEPLTIARRGKSNVVIMTEQDFGGLQETVHLLSSPANAEHLLSSIADADAGKTTARELFYPEKVKQ